MNMLSAICLACFGLLSLSGYYFIYHKPEANSHAQTAQFFQKAGTMMTNKVQKDSEHALQRMRHEMEVGEIDLIMHGQAVRIKGTTASREAQIQYLQEQQHKDFAFSNALASRKRCGQAEIQAQMETNAIEARESWATLRQQEMHHNTDGGLHSIRLEQTKEDNELVKTMHARQMEIDSANLVDTTTKQKESNDINTRGTCKRIDAEVNKGAAMLGQPAQFETKD
jgi:hypothetical protein